MLTLRIQSLLATLWAGSLWTIGYLVAPVLFVELPDKHVAGVIAGNLFRMEAWLSVLCAAALIFLLEFKAGQHDIKQRKFLIRIISGMAACTIIGYFFLQPLMTMLRDAVDTNGIMTKDAKMQFGILHGISSMFYLIESFLAAILSIKIARD